MSRFESYLNRTIATGMIAGVAFVGAGCGKGGKEAVAATAPGITKKPQPTLVSHPLPRCYEHPQVPLNHPTREPALPKFKVGESYDQLKKQEHDFNVAEAQWERTKFGILPKITVPMEDGFMAGDPIYKPGLEASVAKGLVKISTKEWTGSGFLTEDAEGRQVVVTAAHVVGRLTLNKIKIITNKGHAVHPTGGCYLYENLGHFAKLTNGDGVPVDTDVAVLTLPHRINKSLRIAKEEPKRGDWTYFVNYQGDSGPGFPDSYSGLVLSEPTDEQGMNILTGTTEPGKPVKEYEFEASRVQPGASGGPVVNLQGEVVGISFTGLKDGLYDGSAEIASYGVHIPGAKYGYKTGFEPLVAGVISIDLIKKVLESPKG